MWKFTENYHMVSFVERFQDSFSICFHWPFPITNNVPQSNEKKKTMLLIFSENDKRKRNGSWHNSLKTVWNWHCSFYATFWPNIKVLFKFLYCFWPAIKFLFFLPKKSFFFFFITITFCFSAHDWEFAGFDDMISVENWAKLSRAVCDLRRAPIALKLNASVLVWKLTVCFVEV